MNLLFEMKGLFYLKYAYLALSQFTVNDSEQGGSYILHMYSTAYRSQNITSLCHDNEDIQFQSRLQSCFYLLP